MADDAPDYGRLRMFALAVIIVGVLMELASLVLLVRGMGSWGLMLVAGAGALVCAALLLLGIHEAELHRKTVEARLHSARRRRRSLPGR